MLEVTGTIVAGSANDEIVFDLQDAGSSLALNVRTYLGALICVICVICVICGSLKSVDPPWRRVMSSSSALPVV